MTNIIAKIRKASFLLCSAVLALSSATVLAQDDVVLKAMKDELSRTKTQLSLKDAEKPYYVEYRVDDATYSTVSASLGFLNSSDTLKGRTLSVQVRVGDYKFDNTNFLSVRSFGMGGMMGNMRELSIDDDYVAIRRGIWLATDNAYKDAVTAFSGKRAVIQNRKSNSDLEDFLRQAPTQSMSTAQALNFDKPAAENLAREMSAVFRSTPEVYDSEVEILVRNQYSRFINSEGTVFTRPEIFVTVQVKAHARTKDGAPLDSSFSTYGRSIDILQPAKLIEATKSVAADLKLLREAATLDRYNGPVLFEGEAAGAVVADVFGPALNTDRFPITDEPQFEATMQQMSSQMGGASLAEKLGGRVMPDFLDVIDRPQTESFQGAKLMGTRKLDDEGVPTQELTVIEGGILKKMFSTRNPTPDSRESTGSKSIFGANSSNLFVVAKKTKTGVELRQELLRLAKARGYDYGIVVKRGSEGAFSWVSRFASMVPQQSELVNSMDVYKVFADGHEEPVRGIEFGSLTAGIFRDIVAAGDQPVLHNSVHIPMMGSIMAGFGGGGFRGDVIGVGSYIVPSLLFEEISVKKSTAPTTIPPVVSSPLEAAAR
jgi:hypothetical protein